MYEWVVKHLQYAGMEHIKHGENKLAVLCRDAADAIEKLSRRETPMEITEIHVDEYYCPVC